MSLIGKLVYNVYYKPKDIRATKERFGGKRSYELMLQGEQKMRDFALNNLTINGNCCLKGPFKLNFLTGEKFIHQSLFCIHSFLKFLSVEESGNFSINLYDDGSLCPQTFTILQNKFPGVNLIPAKSSIEAIGQKLSSKRFPKIHEKLKTFPLIKKLVYIHINNAGLNTFLDSDMLFLKRPQAFLNWLLLNSKSNINALCMPDIKRSYGYKEETIKEVWPAGVKNNINSGFYAIQSERINYEFIEELINKFEEKAGSNYYLEQLITALLLEQSENLYVLPPCDYIVFPTKEQINHQEGTLHHYVDVSKEGYFKESWKRQIAYS